MAKIKLMDEILTNKIAAGEVVESCASVVKELVENSIDALADSIKVDLSDAGLRKIRVIDNGTGMEEEDLLVSYLRHATSKIKVESDLYNLNTLGFRGEALAAISSVSQMVVETSTGDSGTYIKLVGGNLEEKKSTTGRRGTDIKITKLFYNTPARLKYLKNMYTEFANITNLMNKFALSNPTIRFELVNNDKVILKTDGNNNILKIIMEIYGADVAKNMFKVDNSNDDYKISGYVSKPEINRSNRNNIITLVNKRIVRNIEINRIINDAYHTYKPDNLFPIVVLLIEVDPHIVDVNIHPTKQDIKFSKIDGLKDLIFKTIREKLESKSLVKEPDMKEFNEVESSNIQIDIDYDRTSTNNDIFKVFEVENEQEEVIIPKEKRMPTMYPIASLFASYIVCQNEDTFYLVDQHAAKERINYELVLKQITTKEFDEIILMTPLIYEFSNHEYIRLRENFEFIKELGFDISEFGINSIIVKKHPSWIVKNNEYNTIKRFFEMVISKEKEFNLEKFYDQLSKDVSCKMSIKANTLISISEMEYLLNDLRKTDNPFTCPHGRPVIISFTKYEIEKMFKRTGF